MPSLSVADTGQLALYAVLGMGVAGVGFLLWTQLRSRVRQFGGGWQAAGVMALAVVALLVAIAPNLLPFEIGLVFLVAGILAIYRPDRVVKLTGGPSLAWRALKEGRELRILVRERGGWSVARRNEEVLARVEALPSLSGTGTERYVALLQGTLLEDPALPEVRARLAELEAAEAELRASLKVRPVFERELDRRAAALDGAESST
jgi:hypothetical protein